MNGFADPLAATLSILRAALPGVAFGTQDPATFDPDVPRAPYVMVGLDDVAGQYPVTRTAYLRLVSYGGSEFASLALAGRCEAALLSYPGGHQVRSFGEGTGPLPETDPDTSAPLAYFTVAARLRPITL